MGNISPITFFRWVKYYSSSRSLVAVAKKWSDRNTVDGRNPALKPWEPVVCWRLQDIGRPPTASLVELTRSPTAGWWPGGPTLPASCAAARLKELKRAWGEPRGVFSPFFSDGFLCLFFGCVFFVLRFSRRACESQFSAGSGSQVAGSGSMI